ncbi:hypothetical protein F5884DRAFT_753153 [Xylogone sp. PMI_703]|nr:hypothetical protein F5884DRAFT_753153 [Xylogone sp. PMI_703]
MTDVDGSRYSILARCLQAASGALPGDQEGKLCLITEEDNDLMETTWEGSKVVNQEYITSDVRTNTPAAYLYQDINQRLVFYVNSENILKCSTYDSDDKTWEESDLGSISNQELHSDSGLCACSTPEGIRVYFQSPSGDLVGIAQQNGTWKELGSVQARPITGSPLTVSFSHSDSALYLYYVNTDKAIHYTSISFPDGKQQDAGFPGATFGTVIDQFMVFRGQTEANKDAYVLSSNKIFQVNSQGEKTELGSIEGGTFIPNTTEQRCRVVIFIMRYHTYYW